MRVTDVRAAEALIGQAAQAAEPSERARMLRAALALWRGQPLADVAGLAWMEEQAERLSQLQVRATRALIEARMELGEHAQLIPALEGLTAARPFDEPLHGQLMLALYRDGRQADALAVYRPRRCAGSSTRSVSPRSGFRPGWQATCFDYLGEMHHAAGEIRAARQAWEQALDIFDQLGHPDADQVRAKLCRQRGRGESPLMSLARSS